MNSIALNTVVYNEAHRIVGLLAHAGMFCDELVVVDQGSTDGTVEMAKMMGATVISDKHWGYCEPSRPVAAMHTESDWILALDADEVVDPRYVNSVLALPQRYEAARLGVATFIESEPVRPDKDNRQCRFFRKGAVEYGMTPHSRITPATSLVFESPDGERWIINAKSAWEQQVDLERYASLA